MLTAPDRPAHAADNTAARTAQAAQAVCTQETQTIVFWCAQYLAAEQTDQLTTTPLHVTDKGEQCEYGAVSGGEVHTTHKQSNTTGVRLFSVIRN